MTYDPKKHHRRSIRLDGYDYSEAGAYFVTICVQDHRNLFGQVEGEEMQLNEAGRMVQAVWDELPHQYPGAETDAFVVMPNHVHAIVVLGSVGATPRGCPDRGCPDPMGQSHPEMKPPVGAGPRACPLGPHACPDSTAQSHPEEGQATEEEGQPREERGQPRGVAPTSRILSLGDVVHRFKISTTNRYIDGVKQSGWRPFTGRLWHRNYYEHIIRNDLALSRIRQYIAENPQQWPWDPDNPSAIHPAPPDSWPQ